MVFPLDISEIVSLMTFLISNVADKDSLYCSTDDYTNNMRLCAVMVNVFGTCYCCWIMPLDIISSMYYQVKCSTMFYLYI